MKAIKIKIRQLRMFRRTNIRPGNNTYPLWRSQLFLQDSQPRCDLVHQVPDGHHPLLHSGKVARRVRGIKPPTLCDEAASQDPYLSIEVVRLLQLQDHKSQFHMHSIGLAD